MVFNLFKQRSLHNRHRQQEQQDQQQQQQQQIMAKKIPTTQLTLLSLSTMSSSSSSSSSPSVVVTQEPLSSKASSSPSSSSIVINVGNNNDNIRDKVCVVHEAPVGVNYATNPTIFGKILRGEAPAFTLAESNHALAFEDIHPRAQLHALVIPKKFVESVFSLKDTDLLQEMHDMAIAILQKEQPKAYESGDYKLCFHIPPYNSVDHLHLHVLAPVSKMTWYPKYIKYNESTRWCTTDMTVLKRLQAGKSPVPYKRRGKPTLPLEIVLADQECDNASSTDNSSSSKSSL